MKQLTDRISPEQISLRQRVGEQLDLAPIGDIARRVALRLEPVNLDGDEPGTAESLRLQLLPRDPESGSSGAHQRAPAKEKRAAPAWDTGAAQAAPSGESNAVEDSQ